MASYVPVNRWAVYRHWNRAIADVVYGPDAAGVPAYLDLEDATLAEVAKVAGFSGAGREELATAVRATLGRPTRHEVFAAHLAQLHAWRAASGQPPPVIALLAVLCLAAEDMRGEGGVASHNYYDRLMPLLHVAESDKAKVVAAYRDCSSELWGCLNGWLEDLQGERGLPTAYSLAHEHVGRPISQALIRGVERDKLEELFDELDLPPRTRMSPPDMTALLDQWVSRRPSPVSHSLQGMWRNSGARERVVEVACHLLALWEPGKSRTGTRLDPHRTTEPRARSSHAGLVAELGSFPVPYLQLSLVGAGPSAPGDVVLTDPDSGTPITLGTVALPGDRWCLADPAQLDPDSLLSAQARLVAGDGTSFERRPRRLVPLLRDDLLQAFVEGERPALGGSGLLICHEQLAAAVDRALAVVARPGYVRWVNRPDGAPQGWTLFSDVQILAPLPSVDPLTGRQWPADLNQLQPLGTSQIVLEGGLQLPGRVRRWSSLAAPEFRIVTTDSERLDIEIRQVRTLTEPAATLEQSLAGPAAAVDLNALCLPDGDYELRVSAGGASSVRRPTLDVARLRLRSADVPNSATAMFADTETSHSTPQLPADRQRLADGTAVDVLVPKWWTNRLSEPARPPVRPLTRIIVPSTRVATCVKTGAHYIEIPLSDGTSRSGTVEGTCRDCGLVKRYPARYRRPTGARLPRGPIGESAPLLDVGTVPTVQTAAVGPDVVLDALSHDRRGNVSGLHRLAVQVDASPLVGDRLTRALEVLDHLTIHRDQGTGAATDWEVRRTALAQTAENSFVLTGARSRRLQTALEAAVGGPVERTAQDLAPTRIRVRASADRAYLLAAAVRDATGVEVDVTTEAPRRLAAGLCPLSEMVRDLPLRSMVSYRRCQRWDADSAHWMDASDASTPGVFKLLGATTTYCIRSESDVAGGMMRQGDPRIVKHAAALAAGASLIGYDPPSSSVYVPLGADLPEPFARVAVLCSGLLPDEDTGQRITRYRDVPPSIAGLLSDLLTR